MSATLWAHYVRTVVRWGVEGEAEVPDQAEIARRASTTQPTVSRWVTGKKVPTEAAAVASFARAFGRNVLEAFVAAGMLTLEEAKGGLEPESVDFLQWLVADRFRNAGKDVEALAAAHREAKAVPAGNGAKVPELTAESAGATLRALRTVLGAVDVAGRTAGRVDVQWSEALLRKLAIDLHADPSAGSGAFLLASTAYLESVGEEVPAPARATRNQLLHGQPPGQAGLAEAEQVAWEAMTRPERTEAGAPRVNEEIEDVTRDRQPQQR